MATIGAADMVTTLNSSGQYGFGLVWVFVVGLALKFVLTEAIGRLQLTSDRTFLSELSHVGGRILPAVFFVAVMSVGFLFGAGLSAISTLSLQAVFPGLPYWPTFTIVTMSATLLVGLGKYGIVEKSLMGFGFLLFFGMLWIAVLTAVGHDPDSTATTTILPRIPHGSFITLVSLVGGVGGGVAIIGYSYWIREKKWRGPGWAALVRIDATCSYIIVGLFALVMTTVGTFLLFDDHIAIGGSAALLPLADSLVPYAGEAGRILFLISLFAIVYTSIVGGFSAFGYILADSIRVLRRIDDVHADREMSPTSLPFRLVLLYLTVCTFIVSTLGKPVALIILMATSTAFVLPILSFALLVLLNRRSAPGRLRNGRFSNVALGLCLLFFGFLAIVQVLETMGVNL